MAPLLFGSGACALVYQTVWLREFRLFFGASTAANAAVLAVFIGGLGAGGLWLGARADRHERPLAFYAKLELAIALWAAATPGLLWLARAAYLALGGSASLGLVGGTLVRLLLTALVLAGPTVLMGGTLPAVARGVETPDDRGRRSLGLLYGINTLGAVAGCVLGTFLLLEVFGSRLTLWLACLVNVLIGMLARVLSRSLPTPAESGGEPSPESGPSSSGAPHEEAPPPRWLTLSAAAIVGFAFFLMELVWYRMLGPLLGGTIFSFGLILAVALLGIGLGGAFYASFGRARPATISGFSLTCLLEAAVIALPFALGDRIAVLALYLRPLGALGFSAYVGGWTLVTAIVVLPAAFVAGVQFPLLIGLLGRGRAAVGQHVGLAYAANTGGSIAGALAGGFGLIPLLSAPGCWRAVALLLSALGLAAAGVAARRRLHARTVLTPALLAIAVVPMLLSVGPTAVWRHSPIGVGRVPAAATTSQSALHAWKRSERGAILWEADGIESSVAMARPMGLAFVLNGKVDGQVRIDAATQVMLGLVGAALHPAPKSALVVGLGTGSTAGWLAAVPSVTRVDVVELEPLILRVAAECRAVNHGALDNPKVTVTLGDARELLLTSSRRYDLIASEPSNPYRAGISTLFTAEYYRAVRERLAPGGLFLQWTQAYQVDASTIATIYATLGSVFPAVETWELGTSDLLLIGSERALTHDVPRLTGRLDQEPLRSALARAWRTTRVEGFLSHFIGGAGLGRALGPRPGELIGTDDQNPIEFGFARAAGVVDGFSTDQLRTLARAKQADRPTLGSGSVDWLAVDDEWNAFKTSEQESTQPSLQMPPGQRARALAQAAFLGGDLPAVLAAWRTQEREPIGPTELALLALALAGAGDDAALPYIERLRALEPVEAAIALGRLRAEQRQFPEAAAALIGAFERYRSDPWPWTLVAQAGLNAAVEVATLSPEHALALHASLRAPFSSRLMDDARVDALSTIAMRSKEKSLCLPTLAELEPNVPWRLEILAWRANCYEALGNPKAELAAAELGELVREQPARLTDGL
jgi:spermidine synthase